jgi:hypothetical protein
VYFTNFAALKKVLSILLMLVFAFQVLPIKQLLIKSYNESISAVADEQADTSEVGKENNETDDHRVAPASLYNPPIGTIITYNKFALEDPTEPFLRKPTPPPNLTV